MSFFYCVLESEGLVFDSCPCIMAAARRAFLSCTPWHIRQVLLLLAKIQLISMTSKSFNT